VVTADEVFRSLSCTPLNVMKVTCGMGVNVDPTHAAVNTYPVGQPPGYLPGAARKSSQSDPTTTSGGCERLLA